MPELKLKFDRHGLGDCVHFAHALQLYQRRGYDVTVQVEDNKKFVWQLAGVTIVQGGDLPDHPYIYPSAFEDLNAADHDQNKVAFGLRHDVMPPLAELELTPEQAWDELCAVRLSAHEHISAQAHAETEKFLEGLPRPIICIHSRGTNWHERKSIPTDVAFETILKLLDQTDGSVVVLDFDRRAPMVGDARCKGIKPSWGHIGIDRLCALYERCDLMIGVDSGPFHVASFTPIKALGVFRSLHPNRVCLPNPNAVYLVSDRHADQWESRRDCWNFETYHGVEPTADDIVDAAIKILHNGTAPSSEKVSLVEANKNIAGRYEYHRVGHDRRPLELRPDGTIGEGNGDCEGKWFLNQEKDRQVLFITGKHGVTCQCERGDDGVFRGRWTQFERMPVELTAEVSLTTGEQRIEGDYFFERIGDCEFPIKLLSHGAAESKDFSAWGMKGDCLWLGGGQIVAMLKHDPDGCWRDDGAELIRASRQPFRSFGEVAPVQHRQHCYHYVTLDSFKEKCFEFARSLPPIKAIAGVPRSGLLAASLMALDLNCALIPLETLLQDRVIELPIPRRGRGSRFHNDGMILVVDDSASSGRLLRRLRSHLPAGTKTATVFCNPDLKDGPDFFWEHVRQDVHFTFEWAVFHDDNAEFTLSDMDGVLCEDWHGGLETEHLQNYEYFLSNAKPRRIPSYALMGIVTNRLEKYRPQTEAWLATHGVRYQKLIMSPHSDIETRDRAGDSASRKAGVYAAHPEARIFIESCRRQACEIKRLTGRPVLSIEGNSLV